MNITRLFRRNARTLLMVFMSVLLVTFLIPTTMEGCGDQSRQRRVTFGRAFNQTISDATLQRTVGELELIQSMLPPQMIMFGREDALEYYLLVQEAERAGLRVGRGEVVTSLGRGPETDAMLRRLAQRGLSYDQIYDTLARYLSVTRLMGVQVAGLYSSLPRLELAYRDAEQQVDAQFAVIDCLGLLHLAPEPNEAELLALFEEGKERNPASDPNQLVVGYRLKDRVQIEYLTVDPAKVKARLRLSGRDVRKFWEDNRIRYMKSDPTAPPPVADQPPAQIEMTFEEAEPLAREDLRAQRALEQAQLIVNNIYNEAHRPWGAAPAGADGFVPAPEGLLPSFEELRAKFSTAYEVDYHRSELAEQAGLQTLPGFSQAQWSDGRQRLTAPQLAFRVKGLMERHEPNDTAPAANVMEPFPVVLRPDSNPRTGQMRPGQAYVFRVTQVAPNAPPASLDEVRDKVVYDWKRRYAFEAGRRYAEQLAESARQVGLSEAVNGAAELKEALAAGAQATSAPEGQPPINYAQSLTPFTPPNLTRRYPFLMNVGSAGHIIAAAFEAAEAGGDARKVLALPAADNLKWVVTEVKELKPLYAGTFEQRLAQGLQQQQSAERQMFSQIWTSPDSVQKRTGFVSEAPAPAPAAE